MPVVISLNRYGGADAECEDNASVNSPRYSRLRDTASSEYSPGNMGMWAHRILPSSCRRP